MSAAPSHASDADGERQLVITRWPAAFATSGTREALSVADLISALSTQPTRVSVHSLTWIEKSQKWDKLKTRPGVSLATFGNDGPRTKDNADTIDGIGFDYDAESPSCRELLLYWQSYRGCIHSTFNDGARRSDLTKPGRRRFRLILIASRPMTRSDFETVWQAFHVPVQLTAKYAESWLQLLDSNQRPGGQKRQGLLAKSAVMFSMFTRREEASWAKVGQTSLRAVTRRRGPAGRQSTRRP